MTTESNLPAVLETTEQETDSWIPVLRDVAFLAEKIAGTEFVPKGLRNSVPATVAAILYGREVGLPPMTALTQTHVIEGKPSMSAEAMRAMVLSQGHELEFIEATGAVCRMRARRNGRESWTELVWTLDMAKAAGLLGKTNWKSYPRSMLIARCTADLCRMVFPDVIHGFRAVEEMEDVAAQDGDTAPLTALTGPTTKVSRKRATPKRAGSPPTPAEPRSESAPPVSGPPLPGEPGYDTPPAAAVSDDGPSSDEDASRETNEDTAAETPAPAPEEPSEDIVDGELVEDPPTVGEAVEETIEKIASPRPVTRAQQRMMFGQFTALGVKDDPERYEISSLIVGRPVDSSNDLTHDEASTVIDTLGRARDYNALALILDAVEAERLETPLPLDLP